MEPSGYVRADLYAKLKAENEVLKAEVRGERIKHLGELREAWDGYKAWAKKHMNNVLPTVFHREIDALLTGEDND